MAVKPPKTALAGHTAGIFADMTLDGPEIGTLVAVVDRAKNLPNRRTMGKQDPYCAMRLGKEAKKTDTDRRGGQTPKWDQELRFTVRDAPDYYRLKCSVFNDDKKTDLIGEAWISLSELIKPGGGSNDLWHQLNYKGKYAGDVRVELTYYDLRPREERITEKKKLREKVSMSQGDATNTASTPRQLGPREVRRRPLPASPAAAASTTASPLQTPPPAPPSTRQEPPVPPPKVPFIHESQYAMTAPLRQQEQQPYSTYEDPVPNTQVSVQHYRQPFCEEQSPMMEYQEEHIWNTSQDRQLSLAYDDPSTSVIPFTSSPQQSSWQDEMDDCDYNSRRMSYQPTVTAADSMAPSRALPSPPAHSSEQQLQSTRPTTVARSSLAYRDSPLRQSINPEEFDSRMDREPDLYGLPPPPPMHRDTPPRKKQEYPPSSFPLHENSMDSFSSQQYNAAPRRLSIEDRSPLQQLEQQYDPYENPQALTHLTHARRYSHDAYRESEILGLVEPASYNYSTPHRNSSYEAYENYDFSTSPSELHSRQSLPQQVQSYSNPRPRSHRDSYDDRRLSGNPRLMEDYPSANINSHSQPDLSQPHFHRPEPIRPKSDDTNPYQRPQRKAVSEEPYVAQDGRRLSAVPFGPDAYDVLNPASSPVTNRGTIFQTATQAKEAARMSEVEKLRDQGPIIGNDGRVIDPSDHLPSDTWAPEPERKQRRPEHVIHVRTKNDSRSRVKPNSVSALAPMQVSQYQHISGPQTSRPTSSSTATSTGRNRLQKQPPVRPLPAQPYSQVRPDTYREGSAERNLGSQPPSQQSIQRYSQHEVSPALQRPSLSEYQVPPNNSYVPRGSSFQEEYQPRMNARREYNPRNSNIFNDPLAAEMNMIDIGPSRGGHMVLSGRRGY